MKILSLFNSYTIGFTKKDASAFFNLLKSSGASHLIDVRLHNTSQLAGYTKKDDLQFFIKEILNWDYQHIPELAPTKKLFDNYKKHKTDWSVYESEFFELMEKRNIEKFLDPSFISNGCLLCSENLPHHCHRRLVLEYLNSKWNSKIEIKHLY